MKLTHQLTNLKISSNSICNFNQQFYVQLGLRYSSYLKSIFSIYQEQLHISPDKVNVKVRIKTKERFLDKLMFSGHEGYSDCSIKVNDIVGIRLIFNNLQQCNEFRKIINQEISIINITEEKNYIRYPKVYGYRSIHLIGLPPTSVLTDLKSLNYNRKVLIELQLRTKFQDFFSKVTYWRHIYDRKDQRPKRLFLVDEILYLISELFHFIDKKQYLFVNKRHNQDNLHSPDLVNPKAHHPNVEF